MTCVRAGSILIAQRPTCARRRRGGQADQFDGDLQSRLAGKQRSFRLFTPLDIPERDGNAGRRRGDLNLEPAPKQRRNKFEMLDFACLQRAQVSFVSRSSCSVRERLEKTSAYHVIRRLAPCLERFAACINKTLILVERIEGVADPFEDLA